MKGHEFRAALLDAGMSQKEFADLMEVHRTVIGRQFAAERVDPHWVYAFGGVLALRTAQSVVMLVKP